MAVKTTYELFDIVDANKDYSIKATDLDGVLQTVISSDNAVRYITRKYGERKYAVLTGGSTPADLSYGKTELHTDFRLWLVNRQHNIDKQYQALFDYDYSPIENVDRYENETINRDISTEYGKTDTESGSDTTSYGRIDTESGSDTTSYGKTDTESGTDSTTYGKTDTESGTDRTTYGKTETNSGQDVVTDGGMDQTIKGGDHTTETQKAGFNAPNSYTPAEKVIDSYSDWLEEEDYGKTETTAHGHVVTNGGQDSIAYGKTNTQGGQDSISYGKTNTQSGEDEIEYGKTITQSGEDEISYGKVNTQGGEDTTDDDTSRTLHVHGNIGVTTNNQLIDAELNMRMISLAEMLLDNFINDYTYYA